jgi:hypothetical protein
MRVLRAQEGRSRRAALTISGMTSIFLEPDSNSNTPRALSERGNQFTKARCIHSLLLSVSSIIYLQILSNDTGKRTRIGKKLIENARTNKPPFAQIGMLCDLLGYGWTLCKKLAKDGKPVDFHTLGALDNKADTVALFANG